MNRGTSHNIMTQLGMTADEYNLVTVAYYVSHTLGKLALAFKLIAILDPVHCG